MITRLYIDNYRCFVNFDLPMQELTLLVGVNGAGKSSVFDLLFGLRELLAGRARVIDVFPSSTLTRWQSRTKQTVECGVDVDGDLLTYRLEIVHEPELRKAHIALERLSGQAGPLFEFRDGDVTLYRDDHTQGPTYGIEWSESAIARVPARRDNARLTRFLEFMTDIVVCGLYPKGMSADAIEEARTLARNGSNFASWCRHTFQERQDIVPDFLADLKNVIEGLAGMRLERVSTDVRMLLVAFQQAGLRFDLRFDELSDGERALIALYALTRLPVRRTSILFLDEPDNYLALPELQPWLFALKDALGFSVAQAVVASHHPELIDYLGAEAGVWFKRIDGGATQTAKMLAPSEGTLKLSELIARGWQP